MTAPDAEDWEAVARETLWWVLTRVHEDAAATLDPVADALYWGHDLDAEQVEAARQLAFDLRYVTEVYLARLCPGTEPWADDAERTPSRLPNAPSDE